MSTSLYRSQVAQHQRTIARLLGDKVKKVKAAATAGKKSADASAAAAKTSSASTMKSKLRDATRYDSEQTKALSEVSQLEKKIFEAQKRLTQSEQRLAEALKRELRRSDAAQEQRMRQINDGLSRHEELHDQTAREIEKLKALPEKITVVFFAADPGSDKSNRLLLDEEARLIGEKIRASEHRDVLEFHTRWAVRPMDVFQAMNELQPTIVHFSGHGTTADTLVLQDDQGNAKHVPLEGIVSAMAIGSESLKLVFFNTCHSFNQAEACIRHIPAAIGMNRDVGDLPARFFAAQFYSAIGFGHSIHRAFLQAKALVAMEFPGEEAIPEVYEQDDESLILVRPLGA
ncbi:hypothetical protein RS3R6_09390 [Pseudomonas atacamensis]|uniref:CHAT domain-containing protein n=1 Tax=Pseudomonas atacamensis TaxID=2565368 RepID=A0ABQ5PM40_9PSED|nr:hypothetical protein [Pseudomonas atacamensis]GLH44583.1 hypothetical protein RS3R1_36710 [Pseudomonas atacamensis]GLH52758.1 hypothetical protein RS3R6_09390 [Pseudomonas atacamensis]